LAGISLDDNFASIVKVIMWGRCVNDAIHKLLEFHTSTKITAVIITFVSAVASHEEEPVLTAVEPPRVGVAVGVFAALALASGPATQSLLDKKLDTHGTRPFDQNDSRTINVPSPSSYTSSTT